MMALMALASGPPGVQCSKDGYNIYKDLILRGKFDALEGADEQLDAEEVSSSPKLSIHIASNLSTWSNRCLLKQMAQWV